jgi:hypothetical protein
MHFGLLYALAFTYVFNWLFGVRTTLVCFSLGAFVLLYAINYGPIF